MSRLFYISRMPTLSAVCTLAGAASRVLSDLVEHRTPDASWDKRAWQSNGISSKDYFQVMRRAQDFLKHADRDPDAVLDLNEQETEDLMFFATLNAGELGGLPVVQCAFQVWYFATHGHYFPEGFEPVTQALEAFPGIEALGLADRKREGLLSLKDVRRYFWDLPRTDTKA